MVGMCIVLIVSNELLVVVGYNVVQLEYGSSFRARGLHLFHYPPGHNNSGNRKNAADDPTDEALVRV